MINKILLKFFLNYYIKYNILFSNLMFKLHILLLNIKYILIKNVGKNIN
jgi:hypothetical protein